MNTLINPEATPITAISGGVSTGLQGSSVPAPGSSPSAPATVPASSTAQVAGQAQPAAALDKVAAEPGVLQKALGMAQPYLAKVESVTSPYVEKVQQTTKPYTDAALNKALQIVEKMEGPGPAHPGTPLAAASHGGDGATSISSAPTEKSHPVISGSDANPAFSGSVAPGSTTSTGQTIPDRLDGMLASIQQGASKVASKIDEKTATPNKAGWASQLFSGVQKVTEKADAYLQAHAPNATNQVTTAGHPIMTTTNTLPHTDKPAAVVPSTAPATTSAGAPVPVGTTVPAVTL